MSTNVGEIDLSLILNSDKFSSQLGNIDKQANVASSRISSTLSKIGKTVAVAFSVTKIVQFGKTCVSVASETANAWIGLNSILTGQGKNFQQAKSFINEYVSDGLVPLNNAVASYKNLALRGYSSEQIQKTMNALKNSATFARQSTYSLGDAVQTATEGLKNENSVVVDNAGVTKNVAKMWEEYAQSIGTTSNKLTQQQKIQAEVNGILEETKFQSNDASIYASTYSGKLAQLSTAFTNMKTAIGNVIQPIAKLFIPIITTATNAVTKLFTAMAGLLGMFGLKADSVETVSNGLGDITANSDDASTSVDKVGDSAKKTADKTKKASKKMSNNLADFDKINVLNKDDKDSDGGNSTSPGGSTSGVAGLNDSLNVKDTIKQDESAFNGILDKAKELAKIFKEGFKISFGKTNFNGILKHLNNIKKNLKKIWTDPEVVKSAKNWVKTCLFALGQAVGAVARIGVNIAEGLIGAIDKYLDQNVDRIKDYIKDMFDISSEDIALVGNFMQALGEISDVFKSDTVKQIGANLIAMFANPIMSISKVLRKFKKDLRAIFLQPIIDNAKKIKTALENTAKPIKIVTGTLAKAFTFVGDKLEQVYDDHIHPLLDSIKTGLSDTFGKFLDVYNKYVAPALKRMAKKLDELWEKHLKALFDELGDFIGSIADKVKALWENVLKPVVDWIIKNVVPKLVPIIEKMWSVFSKVIGHIADTIKGIIKVFKGINTFIAGVFSGNWKKAWTGVKTIFSGIWDAIKGIVKAVWSGITGTIGTKLKAIKAGISTALKAVKDIWKKIWNSIKSFISSILTTIKSVIKKNIDRIKTTLKDRLTSIKTSWYNTWNNIKAKVVNMISTIKTKISDFAKNIKDKFTGIKNKATDVFNTMKSNLTKTVQTIVSNIKSKFGGLRDSLIGSNGIFNKIKSKIIEIFGKIKDGLKRPLNAILGGMEKFINNLADGLNKMISKLNALKIKIPDGVPGMGGKDIGFSINPLGKVTLRRLYTGGIVESTGKGVPLVAGERGKEGIVPLTNKEAMNELGQIIGSYVGNGTQEININFTGSLSQLAKVLKPALDKEAKRKGVKLVLGGA